MQPFHTVDCCDEERKAISFAYIQLSGRETGLYYSKLY